VTDTKALFEGKDRFMDNAGLPRKFAVIFPGMGYNKDKPLLYHAGKLVRELGYDVIDVEYHDLPQKIRGNRELMIEAAQKAYGQAEEILADIKLTARDDIIFIGKSIGTFISAKYVYDHNLSAIQIWYTPVEPTYSFESKKTAAFIGDADPWSDYDKVKKKADSLEIPLYTYSGCNHSLERGDTINDVETLMDVIRKTSEYLKANIIHRNKKNVNI